MKNVLILTKTNWSEAPRIRHQITRLLLEKGYQIVFVEKNTYKSIFIRKKQEEGIQFYSHAELIHHQLRYFPFIQKLNNLVVKFYLTKIMNKIEFDFIMNFSYEYSFLKELAPHKKIITMIEDDFETQAKFGMTKQIRNQVKKTCKNSDHILTVSYPLYDKLVKYNSQVSLLFPWSQKNYTQPKKNKERNTVLYFGYIGRLNWNIILELVDKTPYEFRFVGPTVRANDLKMIQYLLKSNTNFKYVPFSKADNLQLDDVFCSILPYNENLESVQQCTVSNRVFNLLSSGLPLAYANLERLIEAPTSIIRKNTTFSDYRDSLKVFHESFYSVQEDIEVFLKQHYKNNRWKVLEEIIEEPLHKQE